MWGIVCLRSSTKYSLTDGVTLSVPKTLPTASRGIFPSQLIEHELWWTGPAWLLLKPSQWPKWESTSVELPVGEREICLVGVTLSGEPMVPFERYSTFTRIQHVVAWILRFVNYCRPSKRLTRTAEKSCLTVPELIAAEKYLVRFSQEAHFADEITQSRKGPTSRKQSTCTPPIC